MTYEAFLKRVQEHCYFSSPGQAERAVMATFETLRTCFAGQGIDAVPPEIRKLIPPELLSLSAAEPELAAGGD